ncbi:PAS domain-containing protein [Oceanibaculum sp.]|uniref:PAS domain-containing protein n=1 Tax=Oceanibaculum sp. TaxID=1903597 RepID=UPI00258FDE86|nr:PAS domain-containing protein [Oceanibaculum sp.]MCH2395081.1 PAS domain-containing protein [Oceanibaculum sp.]
MSLPPERPWPERSWTEPTDDSIVAAAGSILAAREEVPASDVQAISECVVRIAWVPGSASVSDEKLAFLLDYWRGLGEGQKDGVPLAAQVDGIDLVPALGNIMLLDVEREGFDARYRLYGTKVASKAGRDWTGWLVSEMNRVTRTPAALLYRAGYLAVYRRMMPLFTEHNSPPWTSAEAWRRLILPLADDQGRCTRLLVGNVDIGHRLLTAEQIEEQQRRLRPDD